MSRYSPIRLACYVSLAAVVVVWVSGAMAAQPSSEAARLDSYTQSEAASAGKADKAVAKGPVNCFALSLTPGAIAPAADGSDVVVLFNTSAAQTGEYRSQAMEALNGLLASLGSKDRVQLMAVDLNAVPMTKDFTSAKSADMAAALKKLEARVPLGATDMEKAVNAALLSLAGAGSRPKAIAYLGDGMSRANLLSLDKVEQLASSLAGARVSVNAYLVGVRTDKQLLGTLAAETGGMVYEATKLPAQQAGATLAAAADGVVVWPKSVTWPGGFTVFTKRTPPLRTDRETVVIGTYPGGGPFTVQITADTPAGAKNLSWTVAASPSKDDNSYLARLVEIARGNQGLALPLLGASSLKEAEREIAAGVAGANQLAVQALNVGDLDGAERLARFALQQDPQDEQAQNVLQAVAKRRAAGGTAVRGAAPVAAPSAPSDLNLVGTAPPPAAGASDSFAAPGAMAESVQTERRLIEQQVTAEVNYTVNQARKRIATEPDIAIQSLKRQLDQVSRAVDLNPDVRQRLVRSLQAEIRGLEIRKDELDGVRQREQENLAAAKERNLLLDELARRQEKVRQLMERFGSLMEEGKYRLAEEQAADEAQAIDPLATGAQAGTLNARTMGYLHDAMALRYERQKGVVDMLYQVERSHVPFPDEPPIIYPPAEIWQELTVRRKAKWGAMDLAKTGSAEKKISEELKRPTTVEFMETPLSDVIDYLKDYHKIEIQLDNKALTDVGVSTDTPITRNLKGISLRSALRLMLGELDLTYIIDNEVLLITTPEKADGRLATKVYPVADLVIPVISMGGGMGGGMMGGGMMGGGMGGGMMGGMGGGMGGMGGGMGGMGGGMGGGMFNIPGLLGKERLQQLQQNMQQQGMNLFSVKDDLNLTPDGSERKGDGAPERAPNAKAGDKARAEAPRPIEVAVEPGTDPEAAWDRYFAGHEWNVKDLPAIRETVRRLWAKKKYGEIVGLVRSALRHKHVQPWMYEAMALAMLAEKRPAEEIERAVMSAADFVENPADLMLLGAYLEQLDMPKRALHIYRQVSQLRPLWPEPHLAALRVARALNDLEGIRWSTVGILSQAWPTQQQQIWEMGRRVAAATLEKLKSDGRLDEAKSYEKALDEAVVRDCVAMIHWNGDADLDLLVREPGGTVCSIRNARTACGGAMLGDSSAAKKAGAEGMSEIYVCPKGFSGEYALIIRRVWGKVTANRVTVDLYLHCRTDKERHYQQTIVLKGDESTITFTLADGRRTESFQDFQVAKAAADQIDLRQQTLARQLAGGIDPVAMGNLARSRLASTTDSGGVGLATAATGSFPFTFLRSGAVGYQPVITVLPEGAQLWVMGVISADRRYVRYTGMPTFSGIGEVNTFNYATGESGTTGGGTGGLGFGGSGFGGGTGNTFGGGNR